MVIKIYNTLTRKKELFKPLKNKNLNLFVCGITPQDYPHIGHAKTYVQFDFIVKYLRFKGYKLFYLQNITDIDDRIIERAKKENKSWKEISRYFEDIYIKNMDSLHVDSISKYARATDFIPQIISQVKRMINNGVAYKVEDGYYFDLSKFPDYGKLSKRTISEAEDAISRIDDSINKRNKGDFCLWKFSKKDEPSWKAELNNGRPGWHIEDTSITEHFFGSQYDMHGGARDLIFPHHEAEIAQMESISHKKPFVKYWLHTGFLTINNAKMSKSLKNFITINEVLKKYDYKVIRYMYISNHYRKPMDFKEELLEQSKNSLERLNEFFSNAKDKKSKLKKSLISKTEISFFKALNDDFDTPKAFAILFEFIRQANKIGPNNECYKFLKKINEFLDIINIEEVPKKVVELAKKRLDARLNKKFTLADEIRKKIESLGYRIDDSKGSFKIKKV